MTKTKFIDNVKLFKIYFQQEIILEFLYKIAGKLKRIHDIEILSTDEEILLIFIYILSSNSFKNRFKYGLTIKYFKNNPINISFRVF